MTYPEAAAYLADKPLIFFYQSACYSISRERRWFRRRYVFQPTFGTPQRAKALLRLWTDVTFPDGTPLGQGVGDAIPWADAALNSYGGVCHLVMVYGLEIRFQYGGRFYWIAHTGTGQSHLSEEGGSCQVFSSREELFEKARLDGKSLEALWPLVTEVDY